MIKWTTPKDYAGYNPTDDYVLYMRHRDSSILDNSNFDCLCVHLKLISKNCPEPNMRLDYYGDEIPSDWVYTWTTSCWAHGWREYLMVRGDAPELLVKEAEACFNAIDGYPIFNEDDYINRQDAAIWNYWEHIGTSERIHYCNESDVSIFAARRNEIPSDVYDALLDSGEFA